MRKYSTRFFLGLFLIASILAVGISYHYYNKYTWNDALTCYGFASTEQKETLDNLLQKANIHIDQSQWRDTFSCGKKQSHLIQNLLTLVKETQAKFTVRTGTQERWEVKPLAWMEKNTSSVLKDLTILGFVAARDPTIKNPDAICILGATRNRMAERIAYVDALIDQGLTPSTIILLSGERYVTLDVDGSKETLHDLAQAMGKNDWRLLTEAQLGEALYYDSPLSQRNLPFILIDTPAGDLPRPTTQTTMLDLISWLKQHPDIRRIVFVSNQPHVDYQQAIIRSIFEGEGYAIEFEVVGPAAENLDNVLPLLGGLGSFLWATTPQVVSKMDITLSEPIYKKEFQELYAKNPLIYKMLPKNLL